MMSSPAPKPSPRPYVSDEEASQHWFFMEANCYRGVLFVLPLVVSFIVLSYKDNELVSDTFFSSALAVALLNFAIAIHYRLRRHSLAAWILLLFVPAQSITALLSYLSYLESSLPNLLETRFRWMMVLPILILWATGVIWSIYGNSRSERRAALLQAFQKSLLSVAEMSRLLFFHRENRPWGKSHYVAFGTILTSVIVSMRSQDVDSWHQQIPNVVFVVLGCGTALQVGIFCGFIRSLWPLFREYGDITIERTPKR
jgi:hypothetical protein